LLRVELLGLSVPASTVIVGFARSVEVVCQALFLSKMAPSAGLPDDIWFMCFKPDCLVTDVL
jgi:hypothetical protein